MKSKNTAVLIGLAIVLVVINVVAFSLPVLRLLTFWNGYVFSTAAVLASMAALYFISAEKEKSFSFYSMPLTVITFIYLAAALIAGIIFMSSPLIPAFISIIVNIVILGAFAIAFILTFTGLVKTDEDQYGVENDTFFMKSLYAQLQGLSTKPQDSASREDIKKLMDKVRFSDPVTAPELYDLTGKISADSDKLKYAVENDNPERIAELCGRLDQLIEERNIQCRLYKHR